jgi:hypothetical protein
MNAVIVSLSFPARQTNIGLTQGMNRVSMLFFGIDPKGKPQFTLCIMEKSKCCCPKDPSRREI